MPVNLGFLEIELLALILEYVDNTSPRTTKSVALVNKQFHYAAKLVGHRQKTIALHVPSSEKTMPSAVVEKWLQDPSILFGLRHLIITDGEFEQHDGQTQNQQSVEVLVKDQSDALVCLISRLGNLHLLTWNSEHFCIDTVMLEALQKHHPKASLRIYSWHCISSSLNFSFEAIAEQLGAYAPLTTLRSKILFGNESYFGRDTREQTFRRIVSTAPNLKHASILVLNIPGASHRGHAYPAWRESNYSKHYKHTFPNPNLTNLTLDGYPITKGTLDDWGRFVDLSQLAEFKCTRGFVDPTYFRVAPTVLTNLKHVSLNLASHLYAHPQFPESVEDFIKSCNTLETLSLWSWSKIVGLDTILERHGPSLKVLQLHEREVAFVNDRRRVLSTEEICRIRESCPRLEDLTIDVDRLDADLDLGNEADNIKIYEEVAKFGKQFGKLQIYFDLGLASFVERESDEEFDDYYEESDDSESEDIDGNEDGGGEDQSNNDPQTSPSSELKRQKLRTRRPKPFPPSSSDHIKSYLAFIWRTVFGNRTSNTGATSLDAKFGEWERKFGGAYGVGVAWLDDEERLKTCWAARAGERDDGVDAGELGCVVREVGRGGGGLAW